MDLGSAHWPYIIRHIDVIGHRGIHKAAGRPTKGVLPSPSRKFTIDLSCWMRVLAASRLPCLIATCRAVLFRCLRTGWKGISTLIGANKRSA